MEWQGEGKEALATEGSQRVKGYCWILRTWMDSDKGSALVPKYGSAEPRLIIYGKDLVVLSHLFLGHGKNLTALISPRTEH